MSCPECGSELDYLPRAMRGCWDKEKYGKCWCWKCMKQFGFKKAKEQKND